jgi:hypothetical protein
VRWIQIVRRCDVITEDAVTALKGALRALAPEQGHIFIGEANDEQGHQEAAKAAFEMLGFRRHPHDFRASDGTTKPACIRTVEGSQ